MDISKKELQQRLHVIFEKADHQSSALIDIYKLVFPDWNHIKRIDGFPTVGKELWMLILNHFVDFDLEHHPSCFQGGLWLNKGFSYSENLGPWEISLEECSVVYA